MAPGMHLISLVIIPNTLYSLYKLLFYVCSVLLQRRVHSRQVHSETLLDCEREEEASVDCSHTLNLCLRDNYKVEVETDQNRSTMIVIEPTHPSLHDHRTYKLSCSSTEVCMTIVVNAKITRVY